MLFADRTAIPEDLRSRIEREFFTGSAVKLRWELGGQTLHADGSVVVGAQSGPECTVAALCHEMAHFVEIDEPRMACWGWGLQVPSIEVCGQICVEPQTLQMTEREIRVLAFEANILEYLGVPESLSDLVRPLDFMPDFILVPLEDGSLAYGDDATHNLDYNGVNESRFRWLAAQVDKARATFTFERFLSEWRRRNAILRG